jgi:hypothetical protein
MPSLSSSRYWGHLSGYLTDFGLEGKGLIPGRGNIFLPHIVRTCFRAYPTSQPISTAGYFLRFKSSQSVKLNIHLHVKPVKNSGYIPSLPYTPSWREVLLIVGITLHFTFAINTVCEVPPAPVLCPRVHTSA